MKKASATDNNTELFNWVRHHINDLNMQLLAERLRGIDLNAPIDTATAAEVIKEPKVQSLLLDIQSLHGGKTASPLFRVSLFAALCSLALPEPAIELFIKHNAKVNFVCGATTPLHCAIYGNQLAVLQCLFKQGADMHFKAQITQPDQDLGMQKNIGALKDESKKLMDQATSMLDNYGQMMFGDNYPQIKAQLDAEAAARRPQNALNLELDTQNLPFTLHPLSLASQLNRLELFTAMLRTANNRFDRKLHGIPLLEEICRRKWPHDSIPYLDALFLAGVPIDIQSQSGHCPLHIAAMTLQPRIVAWLLQHGADPFVHLTDEKLMSLLSKQDVSVSTRKIADLSFIKSDPDRNAVYELIIAHRKSVLEICRLAQSDDIEPLRTLLTKLGHNHYLLNAPYSNKGKTAYPLTYAIAANKEVNALLLVEFGAEPSHASATQQQKLEQWTEANKPKMN